MGELRVAETLLDHSGSARDCTLHYKNDNNRAEAAVKFRWLDVSFS